MITATRRRREIAHTREDILEAAARAFARGGYRSVTMRHIAREAGYTAASLYTYFKSRDEILLGLIGRVTEEFLEVFDSPVPRGLTFPQRLELLFQRQLALIERRRDLLTTLLAAGPRGPLLPKAKGKRDPFWAIEVQIQRLAKWLKENAAERDLGRHGAEDLARFGVSVVHGFLHEWLVRGCPPGGLARRGGVLLDLVLHGISGRSRKVTKGGSRA